jgi:hypothetical protein
MSNAPTTPTVPLEISDAAVRATYASPYGDGMTNKATRAALELAAPVIVAAELRRLANEVERGADEYIANGASDLLRAQCAEDKTIAAKLRARAAELDGGVTA